MLTAARGLSGRQAPKRATCVTAFILVAVVSLLGSARPDGSLGTLTDEGPNSTGP